MSRYILAIDQGTTGTTVALVDEAARLKHSVNIEFQQHFPKPGWVEHDAEEIWGTVKKGVEQVLAKAQIRPLQIVGLGITNQRETVVLWDRASGRPQARAIVWQCRRTTDQCERLKRRGLGRTLHRKTGLVIDPYFSATKMEWLLKHHPDARKKVAKGEWVLGTIDSYLIHRLSGQQRHVTDPSNASRTQLMNIHQGDWDADLLKLFAIPQAGLPEIVFSSGEIAVTRGFPGLPDGLPISGVAGDQQAALFGQGCFSTGSAKCTFGTGSFILLNTGTKAVFSKQGLLTTVAWKLKHQKSLQYALEGGAFVCGAAVQFLRDQLGFIKTSSEIEALAQQVASSEGVEFVPALTGLGAPHWRPNARGLISGLTRGTSRAHIARATLEAMALQNVEILQVMERDARKRLRSLKVDGGATRDNLLMQIQADYLGVPVVRPETIESTVLGAAFLAGLGVGLWSSTSAIEKIWRQDREFKPQMTPAQRKMRLKSWQRAVQRSM